ncbi:MAG: AAA family ATPase [Candidatus Woesearchaeota archaeon]
MSGRIRKIFLKNIGPYKNENEISFQKLKKNDLNIIIGKNSYGKTSLLKSIKWLFYEKESDRLKNENSNRQEMKTEITFEKEGKIINLIRSDFHGSQIYSNESKYIDFHEEVDKMLPNIVSDFFLFEGEFLSNLFEEYEGQKLKESIMKLSKINRINKIISALKKCQENYRHKITKINKKNKKIKK